MTFFPCSNVSFGMKIKQKNTGKLVNNSLKPIATTTCSIPGLRLIFRAVPGPQPLSPNSAKNNLHKKTPKSLQRKTPNRGKVAQPRVTSDSWKPPIAPEIYDNPVIYFF